MRLTRLKRLHKLGNVAREYAGRQKSSPGGRRWFRAPHQDRTVISRIRKWYASLKGTEYEDVAKSLIPWTLRLKLRLTK